MASTNPKTRLLTFRLEKEGYSHARRNTKSTAQFQSQQKRLVCQSIEPRGFVAGLDCARAVLELHCGWPNGGLATASAAMPAERHELAAYRRRILIRP